MFTIFPRYDHAGNETDMGIIPSKMRWEARLRSREKNVRWDNRVKFRIVMQKIHETNIGQVRVQMLGVLIISNGSKVLSWW